MSKKWIVGILSIVVLICAGIYVYANAFTLQGRVDRENNAIFLEWSISDKSEPYTYKVYQKKEGSEEFQSISTADLKEQVKVLNVYPEAGPDITYTTWDGTKRTIQKAASVEMWMETPNEEHPKGYGMGLIDVDPVSWSDFNENPIQYMRNSDGSWKYDVVFFGTWDANNFQDLTVKARDLVEEFIKSGRGVLFGHDVFDGVGNKNYTAATLAKYVNVKLMYFDELENIPNVGSTTVTLVKRGLLTSYPWDIGNLGRDLVIPNTHTGRQFAQGDVWIKFSNFENNPETNRRGPEITEISIGKGTNNFYLTTWNNTAMIQTGHSNGTATPDEQKVIANTLFYLSQLTNKTSHLDRSGLDLKGPEPVKNLTYNPETNRVSFSEPIDNGSTYQYYVEAIGQDTGRVKRSNTITITNTSGVKGYSYVIDDKPNTEPDDIIDATSNSFKLNLSEATGNILHIKAIDYAGNSSETAHFELQFLMLEGKVDHENNAIDLFWNEMPDRSQPYIYRVYQRKEGSEEFQTISTMDIDKGKKVRVLNVYPDSSSIPMITYTTHDGTVREIKKSASLEMWMETPNGEHSKGYGMGLIDVDPVPLTEFNTNPERFLKNPDGSWKYDTVFFGSWDTNGGQDIEEGVVDLINEFIQSGRGVLLGHDTIYHPWSGPESYSRHPNFDKLAPLFKIEQVPREYYDKPVSEIPDIYQGWGSTKVVITKKGLLTQYPWQIGEVGTVLTIPYTHTGWLIQKGDRWMSFQNIEGMMEETGEADKYMVNPNPEMNVYLSSWNNTAMVQTGHSNGDATPDEQKILANTLFYLSQLTNKTEVKDHSGMDVKEPKWSDTPQVSLESGDKMRVSNLKARDEGSTYEYYVEAIGMNNDRRFYSNTIRLTNTSGLQGFSYVVDDNPDTVPDNKVEVTGDSFTVNLSNGLKNWLHIAPVDRGGNVGEVLHIQIDTEPPTFTVKIEPEGWTNGPVSITLENMQDNGFGYARTKLPNGQFTTDVEPSYVVTKNGRYEFEVFDKVGNRKTAVIEITNIDKELPKVRINELGGEKDRKRIRLEYGD